MEKIESASKEVLVDLVKSAQKLRKKGSNGGWKDFLNVYDKDVGVNVSDPARRTPDTLIAFLKTFSSDDDLKFFYKAMERHERDQVKYIAKKTDKVSPEQELVNMTFGHPEYATYYSFPSHEEGWVRRKKVKSFRTNAIIAVNCETVLCEDGTNALVRVCAVDRDLKVRLNELVKPDKAVADYRTNITGVSAKDLENITCTLGDIQESMKKLLAKGTILIGHSLNNDLHALKMDLTQVIDTSLVFKHCSGSNLKRPSLNDLCKSVLGYEVQKEGAPHDCVENALAAMKLVLAKIEEGVDNSMPSNNDDASLELDRHVYEMQEVETKKLFCHRIPMDVPGEQLFEIIPGNFIIELVGNKKAGGDEYSALVIFKNQLEADQAYEALDGNEDKDSSGRPQKLVSFKLHTGITSSLYVRKMRLDDPVAPKRRSDDPAAPKTRSDDPTAPKRCSDDPAAPKMRSDDLTAPKMRSEPKKRPYEDEILTKPKKVKTDQTIEEPKETVKCDRCDGYLKEIKRLKKKIKGKRF